MTREALIVIQVRFNSKRLLGKAVLPISGMPMITYLIRRLKVLPPSFRLIVATTMRSEDDVIPTLSKEEDIETVRGEDEDVLSRYVRCLGKFPLPVVVRVTADNPLTDPNIIVRAVDYMKGGGYDYVSTLKEYPVGIGVDLFSDRLLFDVHNKAKSPYDREHINAYVIDHPESYKIGELQVPKGISYQGIKLTVDTHDDYMKVKGIIESYPEGHFIRVEDGIIESYKRDI